MHSKARGFESVKDDWQRLSASAIHYHQLYTAAASVSIYLNPAEANLQWFKLSDEFGTAMVGVLLAKRRKWKGLIPLRVLSSVNRHGLLYIDALLRPDADVSQLYDSFLKMMEGGKSWDLLELPELRAHSPLLQLARQLPYCEIQENQKGNHVLDTSGLWADWQAKVSRHFRASLRKAHKHLENAGVIHFCNITGQSAKVLEAYDQFVELEGSGWKRGQGALLDDPVAYGVIRHALEQLSSTNHAGILELRLGTRLIASCLWLRVKTTLYGIKTTYAEDLSRVSPGKLMLVELIRICHQDPGIHSLDFCGHADWYKRLGVDTESVFSVRAFNPKTVPGLLGGLLYKCRNKNIDTGRDD